MKKILVPVDFSEHSKNALQVAAAFAKAHQAEILVVHMMGLSDAVLTRDEDQEIAEAVFHMKLAKKQFRQFLDEDFLKGIRVSEMVQNYTVFEELNEIAKEQDADFIVMGSHGTTNLREEFVGSNTERVVRTAEVPVLVVKNSLGDFAIKQVLFACDFKTENVKPYREAMAFFEELGVQVHLVYVNLPADRFRSSKEIEERMDDFLKLAEFSKPTFRKELVIINGYTMESALYDYAVKVGADALAISTHGRKGLAHFFKGSIAEHLVNHTQLPVFTFKM
ncbi:universal stress protein [Croceiramulus getboli]|nr:universal stress protein [Flavobacteriaceae bacterium YJPT1-3]